MGHKPHMGSCSTAQSIKTTFPHMFSRLFFSLLANLSNTSKYFILGRERRLEMADTQSLPGSRQLNLKKSFKRGLRSLLTACSDEEFRKTFPSFSAAEQDRLHRLFIQVITSLHEDIEEEFESIVLETQAGTVLDKVEELVEEHNLDPLPSVKSNVGETAQNLSEAKKNELKHLMGLLEKVEEQNRKTKARLELLKKEKQDFSGAADIVHELRTGILNYETGYQTRLVNM